MMQQGEAEGVFAPLPFPIWFLALQMIHLTCTTSCWGVNRQALDQPTHTSSVSDGSVTCETPGTRDAGRCDWAQNR